MGHFYSFHNPLIPPLNDWLCILKLNFSLSFLIQASSLFILKLNFAHHFTYLLFALFLILLPVWRNCFSFFCFLGSKRRPKTVFPCTSVCTLDCASCCKISTLFVSLFFIPFSLSLSLSFFFSHFHSFHVAKNGQK